MDSQASREKREGLVIVNTGNGKGKTTAALGNALRALGWGWRVVVLQFIKGEWKTGEKNIAEIAALDLKIESMGKGFSWRGDADVSQDKDACLSAWNEAVKYIAGEEYDLVILDELNIALSKGWLDVNIVLTALEERPKWKHVIITGRSAPAELLEAADLVSEIRAVKHPFDKGIKAQKGIEF